MIALGPSDSSPQPTQVWVCDHVLPKAAAIFSQVATRQQRNKENQRVHKTFHNHFKHLLPDIYEKPPQQLIRIDGNLEQLFKLINEPRSVSGSDMVALQNQGSLKWLSGEPNGSCNCCREKLLSWEMWHMSRQGHKISLRSLHGLHFSADSEACGGRVNASRSVCDPWEMWSVTDFEGKPFSGARGAEGWTVCM